jgi:glycopeptide antibiotics resistance protein
LTGNNQWLVSVKIKILIFYLSTRLKFFISFSYFSILIYIVFLARRRKLPVGESDRLNLIPLKKSIALLSQHLALNFLNVYYFYAETVGNVALFIPFPFCMAFLLNTYNYKKLLFLGFIASFFIECTQRVLHIGVADIDDILLNTTGAFIGITIIKFIKRRK